MARQLTSVPDTDPPDSDYPAGKIRNDNPPTDGTPVIEELYGDLIQFFHKLMRLAGLSYNNLPENETQGFQFVQAMAAYVRTLASSTAERGTVELATNAETQAGIDTQRAITPAGLESKTATTSRRGIAYTASDVETQAGISGAKIVTPSGLASVTGTLITKIISIGDWNMNSASIVNVAHGVTLSKIRNWEVVIRDDNDSDYYKLDSTDASPTVGAGFARVNSTNVELNRRAGGLFDNSLFDSTSYNRGWIVINYLP
jgi:hypothetical protein